MQSVLRFLAIGDSLTAGFFDCGLEFRPYATRLTELFSSVNIPIDVHQRGVSGEHVVPSMVQRLQGLLSNEGAFRYHWVIVLGGTNDLAFRKTADRIFHQGLKAMYDMVLNHGDKTSKLAVMTVIENGYYSPEDQHDRQRQELNELIGNYVRNSQEAERVCLIDLDRDISFHRMKDTHQREEIWNDLVHLTARGYDQMADIVFKELHPRIACVHS